MKFFLDTASLKDISWAAQAGLIDGITTNPSLLAKQAGDLDPRDVLKEICSLVEGPVSAEVVAVEADAMVREGRRGVRQPLHRAPRRCGPGGDGCDPRGAGDFRQLPDRHRDPRRLDAASAARGGGGHDRRRRGHAAPRRPEEAVAASAHRSGAGAVPGRLEQVGGAREGLGLTYSSPLSQRYASPAMQSLWGERRRIGLWRRLWLALMEVE